VAAFYALTVLYMQNPIYLYFTAGLSLTAVLWLNAETSRARQAVFAVGAVFLSLVAVAFHAGQPFSRTNAELLHGRNVVTGIFADPFPRVGLRLHPAEQYPYRTLASVIQAEVPDGEPIFALPSDAELYFLADRPNPFRFYNTALGVRTDTELSTILDRLRRQPPRVITFRPADKYNTSASHAIMRYVRSRYDLVEDVGGVEVYRIRPTFGRNQPMVTGWSSSFARWNQDLKAEGPVRDWYR
jgi:hypothetical protein